MKRICAVFLLVVLAVSTGRLVFTYPQSDAKTFPVYDNMYYNGKPDTATVGLIASNILYENKIWPNRQNVGVLPTQEEFAVLVRAEIANPGPLILDIESLALRGSPGVARHNMEILATLADWAHKAAPGKVIGYYGTNTLSDLLPPYQALAKELATNVDAFFPSLYSFDDNRVNWEKRAQTAQAEARALDAKKPVYFFLWPQYHEGTARALRYLDGDYWKFQLETARHYANGIVLWGPSHFPWNDKSGWWAATKEFMSSLR